ncbi:MAG: glycoside hydrolase family 88 protein [Prevotella sp.]|nr:glycoside hydrolase family 88 protein [Prevotella sp.]
MYRTIRTLLLMLLAPLAIMANEWNAQLYEKIERSIIEPKFADKVFLITKFGAVPDNLASDKLTQKQKAQANQKAIQKAIDKCSKKGGGHVVVPAGCTFLTGAIEMKSGVNLEVQEGATLQFVFEPDLYPIVETSWEGLDCFNLSPCIYAFRADDFAITGKGTIDGGGSNETWWKWCGAAHFGWTEGTISQKAEARPRLLRNGEDGVPMFDERGNRTPERTFGPKDGLRPQLISFNLCQRVLLEDVTLLRSPFWVIHPLKSTDITVRRVKMINDGPNGDGCDPESCDRVLIEDCFFNTGDDCIAIKSGRNRDGRERAMPSQNIIIRNCEMKNGHGGVVIGSEISGGCKNVFAHDCVMDSPNLDRVLRIKTNSCRGGIIENIFMKDVKVGQCGESVLKINLDYEHNEICCRGNYPTVRNVLMENVTCQKSKYGVQIIGLDEDTYVYDIDVRNCRFNGVKQGNFQSGKVRNVRFDRLYVNDGLVLQEKPYKHYSEWMTYSEMKRVPQSYMLDFSTKPKWSYVMGIELEGMLDTYLRYGGDDIRKYCQMYTDTMINAKGDIRGYNILDYNLDNIRTGHFVTRMYQQWPEAKNLLAMQTMMKQLQDQPRTVADKVYWHKAIYAYQVWLDGIFMGLPYRCLTAPITTSAKDKRKGAVEKIYDDAVDQLKITYQRTLDPKTGLNRHAYDETRKAFWSDKETGLSQHCWGRAQGWYTMALIEVLDAMPESYSRRGEVIDLLKKDFDAILKWQDKQSGVWYQVMDSPGREGNYLESTCSAMFTYALLKAYRKGYVGTKYRDAGIKAYRGIINNFIRVNDDKTISLTQCCSVAGLGPAATDEVIAAMKQVNPKGSVKENKRRDGSYSYYLSEPIRDNDAKGLGPFIWASLEMEMMGFDTDNVMQPIDRMGVVGRNNPVVKEASPLASLTVGNGHFATTVDVTGLQSFPFEYGAGVPLTAMSDWGWHKFKNTAGLTPADSEKTSDLGHGHPETYAVEYKASKGDPARNVAATEYFRVNPHRLNLGVIGLDMKTADGKPIALNTLKGIHQELKLYDGVIESQFVADGSPVDVTTACMQDRDAVIYRIKSPLLKEGRAAVAIRFPYPTGKHADDAADFTKPEHHTSRIIMHPASVPGAPSSAPSASSSVPGASSIAPGASSIAPGAPLSAPSASSLESVVGGLPADTHSALIEHTIDSTTYYLSLRWQGNATLQECDRHYFELSTTADVLAFEAEYLCADPLKDSGREQSALVFDQQLKAVIKAWNRWWQEGAIVDFGQCTDPRARELERRVVLSQYLTQVNCANAQPPQETGLTYNSWFGRPHLEMTWWHMVDFALWNRPQTVANILDWYNSVAYPVARQIAQRQGFKGVRWMKMTDPWAGEAPSNTGSYLIWQQPHYIYMAEELYRANPTTATLKKYAEQVEETAAFMADFVSVGKGASASKQRYFLQGATAMQESMSKDFSYNHPFELAYWQYGLNVANQWRERLSKQRNEQWDAIIANLAHLPETKDGIYTAGMAKGKTDGLKSFDPFDAVASGAKPVVTTETFAEKCRNDHPAVLGAAGLLPLSTAPLYNKEKMNATLDWVMDNWNWATTWGWDYGMTAMAAARLGQPETALRALLIDTQKNTYLPNGHNFQTADRLRIYLPGNGALLTAVAMMCAGWDGCTIPNNPGFPQDGTWNVRWEGLQRMQ